MSGQGRLPGDVGLTRNLQPVMDAAGSGRTGQDLDEGELERLRQRVLREAEENFKLEIRKLRGEVGTDSRSYHSASSRGDQGAPSAAQGDRAASGATTTPLRGIGMAWQRCQLLDKEIAVVLWSMERQWQVFLLRLVWINEVVFLVLELKVVLGSR